MRNDIQRHCSKSRVKHRCILNSRVLIQFLSSCKGFLFCSLLVELLGWWVLSLQSFYRLSSLTVYLTCCLVYYILSVYYLDIVSHRV